MRTPAQLEIQLIAYISNFLHLPTATIILPHPTIEKQLQLGDWEHFMQGRIHSSFSIYMDTVYDALGETKKSGHMWSAGIIQRLWTLIHRPIWELRNAYVHQKLNEEKITRNREDLMARVGETYNSIPPSSLLARDQHLFEKPLHELLRSSDTIQRAWLIAARVACRERDKAGERDILEANMTLRKWMKKKSLLNVRRGNGRDSRKIHRKKKRVNVKPRRRLRHAYIRRTEENEKHDPSEPIHRSGFFKPP